MDLRRVHAFPDRQISHHLARFRAHDDQLRRLATADKEALRFRIEGHADRCAAGRDGPASNDFPGREIDDRYFVLVHQIHVSPARAVGGQELGGSPQIDGGINSAGLRIDVRFEGQENAFVS